MSYHQTLPYHHTSHQQTLPYHQCHINRHCHIIRQCHIIRHCHIINVRSSDTVISSMPYDQCHIIRHCHIINVISSDAAILSTSYHQTLSYHQCHIIRLSYYQRHINRHCHIIRHCHISQCHMVGYKHGSAVNRHEPRRVCDTQNTTDHRCSLLNTTTLHDISRARHCVTKWCEVWAPGDMEGLNSCRFHTGSLSFTFAIVRSLK